MSTAAQSESSRAVRTAALAVFGVFFLVGVVFATWAGRLPAIRDALAITPGQMGLLLLVGAAGSVVSIPLTGSVVRRFGTVRVTRAAALLATFGLACVALAVNAGSTPLAAVALFVALAGIGAWDVTMNLQGTVVERGLGRAIMPRFHAGFSLGAVGGAGISALAAAKGVPVGWHIAVGAGVCAALTIWLTRSYLPDGALLAPAAHEGSGGRSQALAAWTERRTLLLGLVLLSAALTEGSANDWIALAVVDGFDTSDALGAIAFGLFVASMTLMRFAGTRLLDRYGRVPVLRACAALALVGLAGFGLAPTLPLALVGAVLWGIGAALGFPVAMSAAADDPAHSAARVSVVSSIGYVAFLAGPPLLGMLADHVGYRTALLTIAIPLFASLVLAQVAAPLPGSAIGAAGDDDRSATRSARAGSGPERDPDAEPDQDDGPRRLAGRAWSWAGPPARERGR